MNLLQKSGLTEFVILNEVKNLLFFNNLQYRISFTSVMSNLRCRK